MPTVPQIIDFLDRENCLRLDEEPPWPEEPVEGGDYHLIDWKALFGGKPRRDGQPWDLYGDDWDIEPTLDSLAEIRRKLGRRPPGDPTTIPPHLIQEENRSWDVCAWYQPIHFYGYQWGIFIKERCIFTMARRIAQFVDPGSLANWNSRLLKAIFRASFCLYFLHEQYHHKTECLELRLQVVDRKSSYLPYFSMVYNKTKGTDEQLEEALANADMYHRISTDPYEKWLSKPIVQAAREYLDWSFPLNPPGYRKAVDYLDDSDFSDGENILQGQIHEAQLRPSQSTSDWDMAPWMMQSFFDVRSNIWTIVAAGQPSVLPTVPFFRAIYPAYPPFFKLRETYSTLELIRVCKNSGYTEVPGGKGSHIKLKKDRSPTLIIPGNRQTLSSVVVRNVFQVLNSLSEEARSRKSSKSV